MKINKYKAKKTVVDSITFDSKMEAAYYSKLKLLLKSSKISNLVLQPKFPIIIHSKKVCNVILDFQYDDLSGTHYVDVKGMDTAISRLKRKMVEAYYSIKVELVKSLK